MQNKLVKIPKLNMVLQDSGAFGGLSGQSQPVCGNVPMPKEILDKVQAYVERGSETGIYKKPCVCTAYDSELYANNFDRRSITKGDYESYIERILDGTQELSDRALLYRIYTLYKDGGMESVLANGEVVDEIGYHIELLKRGVPSKISAIFKAGFEPYSAVFENLGMNIAIALDVPTSYNYIVSFDASENPKIVSQFRTQKKKDNLQNVGIVSIDFLQNLTVPRYAIEQKNIDGSDWVSTTVDYSSDQLLSLANTIKVTDFDDLCLVSNWIKGVEASADKYMQGFSETEKQESVENIIGGICKSTLLREFCGDCDFTPFNAGMVCNDKMHIDKYAPNYDYGECFNGLKTVAFGKGKSGICGLAPEVFNSLPEDVKRKLLSIEDKPKKSIEEVACDWASGTSAQNINYILTNHVEYAREFFKNLDELITKDGLNDLVNKYTKMTADGAKPLLSEEEAKTTKTYLKIRAGWLMNMYKQKLKNVDNVIKQI